VTPTATAVLALVAFSAGFVDAIAGGGGLLTVPALLTAGLDPHLALGTNKGQSTFGATASALGFWRKNELHKDRAPVSFVASAIGAVCGALAQLAIDPKRLKPLVLVLLVAAAILIALRPASRVHKVKQLTNPMLVLFIIGFVIGAYDGFFGPGTGSLSILAFVAFFGDGMTRASGNTKIVNLASNIASLITFSIRGTIVWSVALPMAGANFLGAWTGAHFAIKRGDKFVRAVVLGVVGALILKLAYDLIR
jgi:uncharacterized protein